MKRFCLYLIVIMLLPLGYASAQYYNLTFRNYSSNNGLSQSEVECVFEDSEGFLWVGTRFGLTRYDGKDFRVFFHHVDEPASIGENVIKDIGEDSKGSLWFAAYNSGISRLNRLNSKFQNWRPSKSDPNSLLSGKVRDLYIDKSDNVWVGTEEGLSVFDPLKNQFYNVTQLSDGNSPCYILALEEDNYGNIWIGTKNNGLYIAKQGSKAIEQVFSKEQVPAIHKILFDKKGNGWLATEEGLYSFATSALVADSGLQRQVFLPRNMGLEDIEIDAKGNFWLATQRNGLLIYFPASGFLDELKENYASARGLLSNRLLDVYRDSRGGIWVGGENGLQSFYDAAQKFYIYPGLSNISEKLRGASIYGIYEIDNDLLMATSGGVLVYNRLANKFIPVRLQHDMKDNSIRFRSLYREADDLWWVCSDFGMFELIRKTDHYILQRPKSLNTVQIFRKESLRNYLKTRDGKLWVGSTENGIFLYDPITRAVQHFHHVPDDSSSLSDDVVNIIAYDKDSNLLVGHDAGLSILKKGTDRFQNIYHRESGGKSSLSNRYVYDIFDDGSNYWTATYGGGLNLIRKKDYKVSYYTTRDGLCSDAIYTIVPQNDSLLWLGTNKGLSRFDIAQESFENFELSDGMPADEFNMLSKFVNEEGEIFMATINGLISFNPDNLTQNLIPPKVYLSKARLGGQYLNDSLTVLLNRDKMLTIRYGEDLYLEFSPMTFFGNAQTTLKYKIREVGNQWKDGEAGTLLPLLKTEPGSYNIAVQMFNGQGMGGSDVWNLRLVVLPPFWKTLGFRIAAALAAALAIFLIVRTYIQRRLEKQRIEFERQQAVEKERSRISGELHDDIGGGLTAIRLLSEMVKEKSNDQLSYGFFEKISASSNDLIQKMNEIVWALNVNHDNLQSLIAYTRQYAVSYLDDLDIRCEVVLPESIPEVTVTGNNRRTVFLLVKEALNNIAKHAHASAVNILITIGERLHIEVHDNGLGIDFAGTRPGSNGLLNMRRRVEQLKGRLDILNKEGTTVVFDIPLSRLSNR